VTNTAATADSRLLIEATATRAGDFGAVIERIGAGCAVRLLAGELVFRSCLDDFSGRGDEAVAVTLELTHADRSWPTTIAVNPKGVLVGQEVTAAVPPVVISQDLAEVARALFGPIELVTAATRTVRWPDPELTVPGAQQRPLPPAFYAVIQRVLNSLDRKDSGDLAELAVRCGTDKWGALHQYPVHYQRHFGALRDRQLTILEIGVGGYQDAGDGGQSLRMWKHFFPRAVIHGLDIEDKRHFGQPRIVVLQGDQSDGDSLRAIAEEHGPFDIVIDDGSHMSPHVIGSFAALFRYVRPEGWYVIEDLHGSYWKPLFNGSDQDLGDPAYTIGFLKTLIDGLHHEEFLRPDARAARPTDTEVKGLHFYHNIAFIEKGANREGSPVGDLIRARMAR
jgi:8-demethyl-8-alpha-L-rhamnosyltetracenomycin-C 2'-O-methyltransferase